MLRRAVFWFIGTISLALILPWGAYWFGLSRISHYPLPPSHALSTDNREWVWSLAKASGDPVIAPLTPYSYLYDLLVQQGNATEVTRVIWWVAHDHLSDQNTVQRMLWWHLSGTALTIWLSRNWTDQQITAAAFVALQRRGEMYGADQATPDRTH